MFNLRSVIEAILANDELDDENAELSKGESIENLIGKYEWKEILGEIKSILLSNRREQDYHDAFTVLWGAVLDNRDMNVSEMIALMYWRLEMNPNLDENLVWSITTKLKKVEYVSDYSAMEDEAVMAIYREFKTPSSEAEQSMLLH